MRLLIILLLSLLLFSCSSRDNVPINNQPEVMALTLGQANGLAKLPMACIQTEYPNKLGQTLGGNEDLGEPHQLHPAFYGCFDWHSSVHAHWSLVWLLKNFPQLENSEQIRNILEENLSSVKILEEIGYFNGVHSKSYERTYGWAWLLKLAEELQTWEDPLGNKLGENLQPLTDLIVQRFLEFLPKLNYPIRVGEHTNTAFGLCFAWDYALAMGNEALQGAIGSRAREFYLEDAGCPFDWEPSGYDFLSPCLEEIDLMRRVLDKDEFKTWMEHFMPGLKSEDFELAVGQVSDRSDGKLVHLDGLNFSRAWVLYGLADQYPEYAHLINTANEHVAHSLPNLVDDAYEGGHWLGSFAIYALNK
jgi:hypothetical protein